MVNIININFSFLSILLFIAFLLINNLVIFISNRLTVLLIVREKITINCKYFICIGIN